MMEQLEKYFDTAFGAPDGVNQLRGLILTIALQGKLVPQDPKDLSAHEVLKSIKINHKDKYAELVKSNKRISSVSEDSVPYEIPKNWKWVTLSEIGEINPRNSADENLDAGFVPMPLINAKYGVPHSFEVRKWKLIKSGYTHFSNGDTGLAKITPCFENAKSCVFTNLPNSIGAGTTELHIFRNTFKLVEPKFLLAYFKCPKFISDGTKKMTGSAGQKRVPTDYFSTNPFPLPPIKEQQRIVIKIDQLMSRCDELEKLRAGRDQKRLDVNTAAIRKLLDAPDQATFDEAWQFITRHFGTLYTVRENVAELRKAILQLAVMGKLVPQDPKEGTARELLEEIEREKRKMVKEGKMKEPKPLPPIKPEEIPFNIPNGWKWARLGEFTDYNGRKNINGSEISSETWVLDLEDIEKNSSNLLCKVSYKDRQSKSTKSTFITGDVLYGKLRPYLDKVIVADSDGVCTTEIVPIVPYKYIDSYFLRWLLKRPDFLIYVNSLMYGIKMPRLGSEDAIKSIHPIPPFEEQKRIVKRISELMQYCTNLEKIIDAASKKQVKLLRAIIDN